MTDFYQASVSEFLKQSDDHIIGRQSAATTAGRELTGAQLDAWRQQIAILRGALCQPFAEDWHLILEYPIPRRGKRIDTIVLTASLILVIEFKCGSRRYDREAQVQVEDYCLDLRDFHDESRGRPLVPILVATHAENRPEPTGEITDSVAPLWMANAGSLSPLLDRINCCYGAANSGQIDHPRHHHNAILVRRLRQFAAKIAAVEELRACSGNLLG